MAKIMTNRRADPKEQQARRTLKPPKPMKAPKHLQDIANGDANVGIALVFWKLRNQYPEFAVVIEEREVQAFQQSLEYQSQKPSIYVEAKKNATGSFIVVRVADAESGDMIRVSENNQEALSIAEAARKLKRQKEQIPALVAAVRGDMSQGTFSDDSIRSLCDAAMALATEP